MKNLMLTTAIIAVSVGAAQAQSNQEAADFIVGGIAMANARGEVLTIGEQEVGSDNSLTLHDIVFAPESDVKITTDWIKATPSSENDQDVIVTMADTVTFSFEEGGATQTVALNTSNFKVVTNLLLGPQMFMNPEAVLSLAVSADSVDLDTSGLSVDEVKALAFNTTNFSLGGSFAMANRDLDASLSLDGFQLDYDIEPEYGDGSLKSNIVYDETRIDVSARNLPADEDGMKAFVDQNGSFKATFSMGGSQVEMSSLVPEMPFSMKGQTGPGAGEISFLDGVFVYAAEGAEAAYTVTVDPSLLPIPPVTVSVAGARVNIVAPLRPSPDNHEAVMQLEMRDLVIDEALWAMADPTGNLKHEPINMNIDLASNYRLDRPLVESLDEDGVDDLPSPILLGQINSADINRVFLSVAGASVDATGGFTFDNSGPFPMPDGAVDISIVGIKAITDHLVAMGLVDETEIAMGMGMVMAFMQQGDEPDTYSTKIEVNENGVTANGVPLPN